MPLTTMNTHTRASRVEPLWFLCSQITTSHHCVFHHMPVVYGQPPSGARQDTNQWVELAIVHQDLLEAKNIGRNLDMLSLKMRATICPC